MSRPHRNLDPGPFTIINCGWATSLSSLTHANAVLRPQMASSAFHPCLSHQSHDLGTSGKLGGWLHRSNTRIDLLPAFGAHPCAKLCPESSLGGSESIPLTLTRLCTGLKTVPRATHGSSLRSIARVWSLKPQPEIRWHACNSQDLNPKVKHRVIACSLLSLGHIIQI
jgi:hypothetical protein